MREQYTIQFGKLTPTTNDPQVELITNPTEEDKKYLLSLGDMDDGTLHSFLDPDEPTWIDIGNNILMILKRPLSKGHDDPFFLKISTIGIHLSPTHLVIVSIEDFSLSGKIFNKVYTIRDVLLRLISKTINHFSEHLKGINIITDDLQEHINQSMANTYLINMFSLQKSLIYYVSSISANTTLLEKVRHNTTKFRFSPEDVDLLDDIMIDNQQSYRQAEIHSNILADLMDARASIINNNINRLMNTLNIITIAIMVPTFVVSAFSMNVDIPFQHHPFSFWIVMGCAAVAACGFMVFWGKKFNRS